MLKVILTQQEIHEAIIDYAEQKYPQFRSKGGFVEIAFNRIVKAEVEMTEK